MVGMSKPHLLSPGRLQSSWTICIITLWDSQSQKDKEINQEEGAGTVVTSSCPLTSQPASAKKLDNSFVQPKHWRVVQTFKLSCCCCSYLSVGLSPGLVSLAQVKTQSVPVFLIQAFHNVEGALAESLTHGVKEDQDQVTEIPWE